MIVLRSLATALLAAGTTASLAQSPKMSRLRCSASVNVASDVVRIGDVVDNAVPSPNRDLSRARSRTHRLACDRGRCLSALAHIR